MDESEMNYDLQGETPDPYAFDPTEMNYDLQGEAPGAMDDPYKNWYGTGYVGDTPTTPAPKDKGGLQEWLKNYFTGKGTLGSYAGGAMGLLGLVNAYQNQKQRGNQAMQAPIDMNKYKFVSSGVNTPIPRAYGAGAMGQNFKAGTYEPVKAAEGGLMEMAKGGATHYLSGKTDGMADKLDTSIDGIQPAKLSHGEFVVPADVVSHLGNGNSEAGADVLYKMLERVRKARTGNKKQGKKINPEKFVPGGIASLPKYAAGGQVAFADGGATTASPGTVAGSVSPWVQPYAGQMLEQGAALANKPYEAYGGQLTAGTSPLQAQGFKAAGELTMPGGMKQATEAAGAATNKMGAMQYNPMGSDFTAQMAQQYMNPYLQASLNPQLEEARRQEKITQMSNAAGFAQKGAYGGGREAVMRSEGLKNMQDRMANITGQGYNTAYDKAMQQFNADQQRKIQEGQFGSNFGLQAAQGQLAGGTAQGGLAAQENAMGIGNLNAQLAAGATQSNIEQAALDAERAQFQEAQLYPYKQLQFQQSLLTGLPISSQSSTGNTSMYSDLAAGIGGILGTSEAVNKAFPGEVMPAKKG